MDYDFTQFNSKTFEHLIQSLLQKILGYNSIVFGEGKDGARELTFEGEASFPHEQTKWKGYWVIQAKFKSRDFLKIPDYSWIRSEFAGEMAKYNDKKRQLRKPDNYLFYSNIVLTPVQDSGGRDKIEKLKKEYQSIIPNIFIGGYDDVCRMLDNNIDVRLTYSHLLLTSDLISKILIEYESFPDYKNKVSEQEKIIHNLKNASLKESTVIESLKNTVRKLSKEKTIIQEQLLSLLSLIKSDDYKNQLINKVLWLIYVEKDIDKAIEILDEDVLSKKQEEVAILRILRGKALLMKLRFEEAEKNFLKALKMSDSYKVNMECASYYRFMGNLKESLFYFKRTEIKASTEKEKFIVFNGLASINSKLGNTDSALKYYNDALVILVKNIENFPLYEEPELLVFPVVNLANFYSKNDEYEKAHELYKIILDLEDHLKYLFENEKLGVLYGNIGIFYYDIGELDEGEKLLKLSIEYLLKANKSLSRLEYLSNYISVLGLLYEIKGEPSKTIFYYEMSLLILVDLVNMIPKFYIKNYVGQIRDICELCLEHFPEEALSKIEKYANLLREVDSILKKETNYNIIYSLSLLAKLYKIKDIDNTEIISEINSRVKEAILTQEEEKILNELLIN